MYKQVFDKSSPKPWLLYFYTTKCDMCEEAEMEFNSTKDWIGDAANYAKLDANKEFRIATRLFITSAPQFAVVYKGKYEVFSNEPKKERLYNFMASLIGKGIPMFTEKDIDKKNQDKVISFTKRLKAPPHLSFAAANLSHTDIRFGFVNKPAITEKYEITKLPSTLFISKDGKKYTYEGKEEVQDFLKEIAEFFNVDPSAPPIPEQMRTEL